MGKTCCVGLTVFVRADAGWTGTGGALRCGMHSCLARFITVALVSVLIRLAPAAELTDRWVYLQTNLQVDKNVDDAEALFRRAAKAGYTGVLLADSKLAKLGDVIPRYHQNLARVKRIAAEILHHAVAEWLDKEYAQSGSKEIPGFEGTQDALNSRTTRHKA